MNDLITEISMGPFGSDIKVEYFVGKGVPVLNGSNISGFKVTDDFQNFVTEERANGYRKAIAVRGDIVITHRGTLGQIAYIPDDSQYEKYVISQSQFKVRLDTKKVNPVYFTYYFHTKEGQQRLLSFKSHVGVPALAQATTNFRLLDFPLISKPKQDDIAYVLETLDKKIELNNQINTELEAMAKTLYDYWFVQFDFPDADGKPYKTSGGKMVYNEVLKREIPEGWEVSTLANHLACNTNKLGGNHQLKALQYLDTSSLTENVIDSFQELIVGIDKVPSRANMVVSKNDILYSTVRPNLLHYGLIKQPLENMIASTGYAVLSHKTDSSLNVAFYLHITSENNTKKLVNISQSSKSSYPSISPNDILNINIALPIGLDILSNFCNISNPIFDRVSKVQSENKKLEELRDWLLPMLMNGQVRVKI